MAEKKDETQGAEIPKEETLTEAASSDGMAPTDQADIVDAEFEEIPDETASDDAAPEDMDAEAAEIDAAETPAVDPEVADAPEDGTMDESVEPVEDVEPVETPAPAETPAAAETPAPTETIVEKTVVQKRGFWPMFIGGMVLVGLGFGVARYDDYAAQLPDGLSNALPEFLRGRDLQPAITANAEAIAALQPVPGQVSETGQRLSGLSDTVDQMAAQLADVDARLSALQIPDITPLEQGLGTLRQDLAGAQTALQSAIETARADLETGVSNLTLRLDALDVRVSTIEKRPIAENLSDEAIAAYERELDMVRRALADERQKIRDNFDVLIAEQGDRLAAVVDGEKARIDKLLSDAQAMVDDANVVADKTAELQRAAAQTQLVAAAQSAVAIVRGAMAEGAPFADSLEALGAAGVDIPSGLATPAADGVPTQGLLVEEFPPAARNALDAARYSDPEATRGLGAFLQRQLGARSTTPQEGNDTDAILSRAEAALKREDLATALIELQSLPETAAPAMAGWVEQAIVRRDALEALNSVATDLNTK